MAYTLAYSGGTITVNDGTLNSQTSLSLPGRNYAGYGTFLDQNQLSMLEHFASATSGPSNSIKGQVWFDASNNTLKYNTSSTRGTPTWVSTVASGIGQDIKVRNISMESANGTVNGVLTTRNITTGATGTAGTLVGQWNIPAGSALTGNVVIPTASTTQLGGIKVGTGLTIDGNGVLSASGGVSGVSQIVAGTNVTISSSEVGGTGIVTINASGGGGGSGVTSVGITSGDLTVTNSPITGSGSIGLALNTVPINKGGTGQTSAAAAINALMPNQSGNSGALLTTNGTNLSWQEFSRSVGPSGYTTLPGNVILYWGSVTTPNVDIGDHYVMPVTFPAGLFGQVFNVTGIVNSVPSTSGPGGPDAFMSVSNLSATGMNVIFTERNPSFVLSVRTAMFQVIGVPPIPGAPSNVQIAQSWVNNGDGTSNGTLTASANGNTPLTFNWSYIDSGNVLTWSASGNVATIKSPNSVENASTSVSVTVTNSVGSAIGSTVAVNPNYEPTVGVVVGDVGGP